MAKYRVKSWKPPSQTWKSILEHHTGQPEGAEFFTVLTAGFRLFYGYGRRARINLTLIGDEWNELPYAGIKDANRTLAER